ncbi:hypothetical protein BBI10_04190 [Pseudomonas graminis]|uniref:Uncharacterized protein n=2 Tax=Pseudomonas graminis TaxID=158627 RepID=A0A1C2ECM8_9PSED|nr:hypothetical protein BBI10_04190 [Pseudomonas graminis]
MTVIAVTVLQVMSMLFWPVVIISVLLVGIAYWWRQDFAGSNDGIVILLTLIMSVVAQLFFAGLVWGWVESSNQKTATIYRIAHFADFNSSFRCAGLDEAKVRVLFVNPDRSQVITAPKIANVSLYSTAKATWLQPVAIPEEFPQVSCAPQPKRTTPSNEVLTLPQ